MLVSGALGKGCIHGSVLILETKEILFNFILQLISLNKFFKPRGGNLKLKIVNIYNSFIHASTHLIQQRLILC